MVNHMSKMIQIRNVSDKTHRTLKVRAAQAGKTLSDYLREEVERVAERPTLDEMLGRLKSRPRVELKGAATEIIRRHRGPI